MLKKGWLITGNIEASLRNFIEGSHDWATSEESRDWVKNATPEEYADAIIDTLESLPVLHLIDNDTVKIKEYIRKHAAELRDFDFSLFR